MIILYAVLSIIGAGIWLTWMTPKQRVAVALFLALPLAAQGAGTRFNCNVAMERRLPNLALGFAVTWGGARATRSLKFGVGLSVSAGLYKVVRDSRDGNDRASVGTNFILHVAGVVLGAALAKDQLAPEFAKAPPALEPSPQAHLIHARGVKQEIFAPIEIPN